MFEAPITLGHRRSSQFLPEIQGRIRWSGVSILSFLLLTSLTMGARAQTADSNP